MAQSASMLMRKTLNNFFANQGREQLVFIERNVHPDTGEKCPVYLQFDGIGIALYDDGTYTVEDTTEER